MFAEKMLRKMAVAHHDPLLSKSRDPALCEPEGYPVDVLAASWADYMKNVYELAEYKPEPCKSTIQVQHELAMSPLEEVDENCNLNDNSPPLQLRFFVILALMG